MPLVGSQGQEPQERAKLGWFLAKTSEARPIRADFLIGGLAIQGGPFAVLR